MRVNTRPLGAEAVRIAAVDDETITFEEPAPDWLADHCETGNVSVAGMFTNTVEVAGAHGPLAAGPGDWIVLLPGDVLDVVAGGAFYDRYDASPEPGL